MPVRAISLGILIIGVHVAAAHDIPNDVTIQAYLKPDGRRLSLLVRAPLAAMRDIDIPLRGAGYLDLTRSGDALRNAATLWLARDIEVFEGGVHLPVPRIVGARVSLPSDKSFASFEAGVANIEGPALPADTDLFWNQGLLDVLFEFPIEADRSKFSIHPGIARLGGRVVTVLRFLPPGGAVRAFEFEGDPGLVPLDPGWSQAALHFVRAGFLHILDGTDHLLFLFCLVIPFRRFGALIKVVTSFTLAHSITLIASAYDLGPDALWFPPLIETLIAISIVYMALENIVGGASVQRRWIITFAFGLVHGFGFSFALRQTLQFAGSHLLTSLLAFNVGVELGQILVLAVLIPLLAALFRFVAAERVGTIILSALVAHTGWHWTGERYERLRQFRISSMSTDAAGMANALRWAMLLVALAGGLWLWSISRKKAYSDRADKSPRPQ